MKAELFAVTTVGWSDGPSSAAFQDQRKLPEYHGGQTLDMEGDQASSTGMGYERMGQVDGMGQFSVRGGILDVFPLTEGGSGPDRALGATRWIPSVPLMPRASGRSSRWTKLRSIRRRS